MGRSLPEDVQKMIEGGVKLGSWMLPQMYAKVATVASQVDDHHLLLLISSL